MLSGDPLLRAIKIMGSRQEIIKLLGISGQRLNAWLNSNVAMGYEYALALEYLTGGQVTASELAPKKAKVLKKFNINLSYSLIGLLRKQISITDIKIPEHSNKQLNDLESLAADIEKQGLIRPVVVDSNYTLIAGERRLFASKLISKRIISAFVLSLETLLKESDTGYQLRKYFTVSERIAVGLALEGLLGKRQGQRTDLQPLQNFAEVSVKTTTREKVALSIGFNNAETYRQAKKIIHSGIRLLIHAMDEANISISLAFEIAALLPEEQEQMLLGDPKLITEKVKQLKINKKLISEKIFLDSANQMVEI